MTLTPELIQVFGGRIARLRFYTFLGGGTMKFERETRKCGIILHGCKTQENVGPFSRGGVENAATTK